MADAFKKFARDFCKQEKAARPARIIGRSWPPVSATGVCARVVWAANKQARTVSVASNRLFHVFRDLTPDYYTSARTPIAETVTLSGSNAVL